MDFLANMPLLNLIIFLVFIIVIIVLVANILKNKKVKIGNTEISNEREQKVVTTTRSSERTIIKRQIHIGRAVCANFRSYIPHYKNYDSTVIENICYKVSDEIEDLILFNHISMNDEYINSRFQVIWSVIESNLNDNFTDEDKIDLKRITLENFKKLIGILLNVRRECE